MRLTMKYLLAVVLGLLALPALSQETYTLSASANQVADLRQYQLSINRGQCRRLGLALTCTQAQACTSANAPGGASCTAGQARNAGVRIWPDTQAGREEFVTFQWVAGHFLEARSSLPALAAPDYCAWWTAQNQTTKDAECTKIGAPAGCSICP